MTDGSCELSEKYRNKLECVYLFNVSAKPIRSEMGRTHHEEVTCRFHFDAQVTSQEKGEGMRSNKRLANLLVAAGFLYNLKYKHNKAQ